MTADDSSAVPPEHRHLQHDPRVEDDPNLTGAQEGALEAAQGDAPKEWWDDPRMPWRHKPGRADKACWTAFMLLGLYGLVMLPLRPVLLGLDTHVLAVVTGSNIAMVDIGAGLSLGTEPTWWVWLLAASLTLIKFDWIFWWAGRLWGRGLVEVMAGRSRWAARTAHHAEQIARRFGLPAVYMVWLIPFIPSAVVFALVGEAGMRLKTFLLVDFIGSLTNRAIYLYLGYRIGEPAKEVVDQIAKYSNWIAIALVAFIVLNSVRNARKERPAKA